MLTHPLSREPGGSRVCLSSIVERGHVLAFGPNLSRLFTNWTGSGVRFHSVAHRPGTITNTADRVFFLSSSSVASSQVKFEVRLGSVGRFTADRTHRLRRRRRCRRCSGQENTFDIHCGLYCGARPPPVLHRVSLVLRPRDVLAGAHRARSVKTPRRPRPSLSPERTRH